MTPLACPPPPHGAVTPPAPSPKGRRHSAATMLLARTMYGDGDAWSPPQIAAYMTTHGTPIDVNTIKGWVVPGWAAARRERTRLAARAKRPAKPVEASRGRPTRQSEWGPAKTAHLLALGLELRAESPPVPYTAISVIFARYERAQMNSEMLRRWLTENGAPRDEAKARHATAINKARAERAHKEREAA